MGTTNPTPAEDRRLEQQMTIELTAVLSTQDSVVGDIDTVKDFALWRRAARTAGRRLGFPTRTGISRDGSKVWATLERHLSKKTSSYARGRNLQRDALDKQAREAIEQLSDLISDDHSNR